MFYRCPFSVPESHEGFLITLSCHVSLGSSHCDSFSDCLCFWWPWLCWGVLVICIVGCFSVGTCVMFVSWVDWFMGWGRKTTQAGAISITSFQGYSHDLFMTVGDDLGHLAEVVGVSFLLCELTLSSLLPYCLLWKEVIVTAHTRGVGS